MDYGDKWQGEFTKLLCRCAREAHYQCYAMFGVHEHGKIDLVSLNAKVKSFLTHGRESKSIVELPPGFCQVFLTIRRKENGELEFVLDAVSNAP